MVSSQVNYGSKGALMAVMMMMMMMILNKVIT
jgi:hypothetical protein